MSYPEPRYLGERGQVSALFRPASPEPDTGFISYVAKQENTNGEFGLYKIDMGPKAMGATEHFTVRSPSPSTSCPARSGSTTANAGSQEARETSSTYRPHGLHAFQNDSDAPVSLLLLFTPGAPREEYFEKVAEYSQRSREELKAFRIRHDQYNTDMLDD